MIILSRLARIITIGVCGISSCTHHPPSLIAVNQPPTCCQSRYLAADFPTFSTVQLGAEYQRLKRRKCSGCARFSSDFQQLLRVLGERLDGQPCSTLQQVLGRPDRVRGDSLVYYWRGEHDFDLGPTSAGIALGITPMNRFL
jgi:hypothetical protein